MYKQLTEDNRLQIWALRKEGKNQSKIAKLLDINRSTVSRELSRNSGPYGYDPLLAQKMACYRKKFHQKIVEAQYEELVKELMQMGLDPTQCRQFILHYHPELTLEQLERLINKQN
jgi:IS30 family transposase